MPTGAKTGMGCRGLLEVGREPGLDGLVSGRGVEVRWWAIGWGI